MRRGRAARPTVVPLSPHRLGRCLLVVVVTVAAASCQSGDSSASDLVGTWQWTSSTEAQSQSQTVVPDPENYTITFVIDGTSSDMTYVAGSFSGKADCNQFTGTYSADPSSLLLVPGDSTRAVCAEGSLADQYLAHLGEIETYVISGDEMTATFIDDVGSMTFTKS